MDGWVKSLAIYLLVGLVSTLQGQEIVVDRVYYTDEDVAIFDRFVTEMESKKSLPAEQLLIETASFFIGTPYVAATLEKEPEGLVVNFREMDCSTFVDNVIALSRMLTSADHSFEGFCRQLQYIRYRKGTIHDYTDRLHYTSDWVYVNDKKNIVRDINKEIGGKPLDLHLNFMSTHPDSYKQLKNNPGLVRKMEGIESDINTRHYYYIPKQQIASFASKIKDGDIVCITTSIKGLDTSHVGIVRWEGDKLTFIHASSLAKKVIVNQESLQEYLNKGKSSTGIMLARPIIYSNNSKANLTPIRS